jgi:hypothetical protein
MRDLISGALLGLSFGGLAVLAVKLFGYTPDSFMVLLYLYTLLGVFPALKDRVTKRFDSSILHRIVLVAEGEEIKMRKILTGEKYRIKGDVEKL